MATTTNYGWDTPDDTDLVKDGAAAIRTLGSSVDTTTKNLNPQTTTGALAYRSATANINTALPIGTANQVLRVNSGGTAPEWATTADQTPLTTKGDLFTFDTADARLGVGANGTLLTADSSEATGLKWVAPAAGGGLTLLDTMTLSGASTTSATFSSAYTALVIYIKGAQNSANTELRLRLNGDTGNNYAWIFINNAVEAAVSAGTSFARIGNIGTNSAALQNSTQIINLMRPSDTDQVFITTTAQYFQSTIQNFHCTGVYDNSAAITSITLIPGSGTMSAGTVLIYGAN